MSYVEEALRDILESHTEQDELILEHMEAEAEFIMSCLENNIITEAQAESMNKAKDWVRTLIERVKEFFRRVFGDFKDKVTNMVKESSNWIKDNGEAIDNMDYNGLTIEMIPFWNITLSDISSTLDKLNSAITNIPQNSKIKDVKTMADVEQLTPFKDYLRGNDSFANSIKDYFRTSKSSLKPVKISDNELKTKCTTIFKPYVLNFDKDAVTTIRNRQIKLESAMNKIVSTEAPKNVSESFCIIENCLFSQTDLRYCSNYDILTEDAPIFRDESRGAPNDSRSNKSSQNKDDKPNTKDVVLTDKKKDEKSQAPDGAIFRDESRRAANDNRDNYSAARQAYIKYAISLNQIALSAAMDILTEKYSVYLKTLKAVVGARKDTAQKE